VGARLDSLRLAADAGRRYVRQAGPWRAARLLLLGAVSLGPGGLLRRAAADARIREDDARYQAWLAAHGSRACETSSTVRVSVVIPVFNPNATLLAHCLKSIVHQSYPNWELCICDDASTDPEVAAVLRSFAGDTRIRLIRSETNAGIASASNLALAAATGEFVAFVDHDDELDPGALAHVARAIERDPRLDILYTDEDKIDADGNRSQPHFKPDWSPELLRSCMYPSHLTVLRRALVQQAGGLRIEFEGAQDYDLLLRLTRQTQRVAHIPVPLYHWRATGGSAANSELSKRWAFSAARRALEDDLLARGQHGQVLTTEAGGHFRIQYEIQGHPAVTVVVSGETMAHARTAIDKLRRRTSYRDTTFVEAAAHDGRRAEVGAAIVRAGGEHVLLISSDVDPVTADWLQALLEFSQQPEIGAAGPLIVRPDGTIDSAGLVIRPDGIVQHGFRGEPSWTRGHLSNILDVRKCTAVSGAWVMTRRRVFEDLGGFDTRLPLDQAAADFGLRVRQAGLRIVVTPYAKVRRSIASEAPADATNALSGSTAEFSRKWGGDLGRDPYYSPNFDPAIASFRLPPAT
jgi:GT2 family glycosyltransferase